MQPGQRQGRAKQLIEGGKCHRRIGAAPANPPGQRQIFLQVDAHAVRDLRGGQKGTGSAMH